MLIERITFMQNSASVEREWRWEVTDRAMAPKSAEKGSRYILQPPRGTKQRDTQMRASVNLKHIRALVRYGMCVHCPKVGQCIPNWIPSGLIWALLELKKNRSGMNHFRCVTDYIGP